MSVIATVIEPRRVTRVLFDSHDVAIGDQRRIEQAIERSLAEADDEEVKINLDTDHFASGWPRPVRASKLPA